MTRDRDDDALGPGDRVGAFTIRDPIPGPCDVLYRADGPRGPVELRLYPLLGADETAGPRFEREVTLLARALQSLDLPAIRPLHGAGHHAPCGWTATPLPAGTPLREWCFEAPRPWHEIVRIFHEVAAAIAVVETAGVLARDFLADDIHVGPDGRPCFDLAAGLAEFLARPSSPLDPAGTRPLPHRSLEHVSPEEASTGAWSARTTQFTLCSIAWRTLHGRPPFPGDSLVQRMFNTIEGRLDDPPQTLLPPAIHRALVRGLARDPADRHPSMAALAEALRPGPFARLRR